MAADGSIFDLGADVVELAPGAPAGPSAPLREIGFRKNAWMPDEVDRLRGLFAEDVTIDAICQVLKRPLAGVRAKIQELGLRRNSQRPWSEWEEAELQARYGRDATSAIAQDLGRGISGVYARASLLGLTDEGHAPYTAWEDAQICTGYAIGVPIGQIAAMIGRPLQGVCCRATGQLGLRHVNQPEGWSAEEMDRALALCHEGHPYLKVRKLLAAEGFQERSKSGFEQKVRKLGYGRGWGKPYTADEDELIRKTYAEGGNLRALASRLGRLSISWRCKTLGLMGSHPKPDGNRQGPPWTAEEDAKLRAGYGKGRVKYLAVQIGRPLMAVYNRAHHLGLKSDWCRDFTADEDEAIRIAWRRGIGLVILGEALGRQTRVVWKRAESLGVPFGSPDRPVKPKRGGPRQVRPTLAAILAMEEDHPPHPRLYPGREAARLALRPRERRALRQWARGA